MANRRQRTARRLEEQEQDQEPGQEQATEAADKGPSLTSVPAGKPKSARKMFLVLWGIPLMLFIIIAIVKG